MVIPPNFFESIYNVFILLPIQNRRELRLDRVDAEIRTVWNFYRILESYQDNKDQVRTYI